ncbi:MAG TPA: transglutaminase domain-containing protein [Anaerolineae bacterium]|nr:transglutaminase domain-containing protein [Anaerolineae bacterium]
MDKVFAIVKIAALVVIGFVLGLPLYALPATLSLPSGLRPGIKALTLDEAARQLRASEKTGADLVEAARALVADRMSYCRRNSFDSPERAFERGYGYCTQQACALIELLTRLGFEAKVVHAFRNRFPDGSVGGHAWVRVTVEGEARTIDSIHYKAETGKLAFTPLSKVLDHTRLFKLVTGWGEAAVNAHRYYRTGKDW